MVNKIPFTFDYKVKNLNKFEGKFYAVETFGIK